MSTPEPETLDSLPLAGEETVTMHVVPEPEPAAARPFPRYPIGDYLISSMPGFDIPPCGHCGTVFQDATPEVLTAVRPLMEMRSLAYDAGWRYDFSLIWSCLPCLTEGLERDAAENRAEAEAAAAAEHEHRAILAAFDRRAGAAMEARGGEYTCRWSYEEAAPAAWAA